MNSDRTWLEKRGWQLVLTVRRGFFKRFVWSHPEHDRLVGTEEAFFIQRRWERQKKASKISSNSPNFPLDTPSPPE